MGMHVRLVLGVALLAAPLSGCLVPDNMQTLREDLGFAALHTPVVKIRADTLAPVVRQDVGFTAIVIGGVAPYAFEWRIGDDKLDTDTVRHAWDAAGSYAVSVRVRDAKDALGADALTVTVGTNAPPVAVAAVQGEPRAHVGDTLTFTAAGSSDANANALTYAWRFDDGASATGLSVTHAFSSAGPHAATVVVSDGLDEATATAGVAIDQPVEDAGDATLLAPYSLPFQVNDGAASFAGLVTFTRRLQLEQIEVVLRGPDGSEHRIASASGIGSGSETVPFDMADPAPGAWAIEVAVATGYDAAVGVTLEIAYRLPR